uniref:Ribosomal protein S2 n=1 Tax=Prototheca zopfii TaxID=3112 RepID=A0A2P1G7U2_9CHLO|nr:ribosomal protein S2 [Prototheca ciferrii]AVM80906.1 ribosomal protein S2 [Prototheca ciferrii]
MKITDIQNKQLVKPNTFGFGNDFKAGIQLGACHNPLMITSPWNSSAYADILGISSKVPVINSLQTKKALVQAFHLIISILKRKGNILIVNTKNSAHFSRCNQFITSYESEHISKHEKFESRNLLCLNHERIALCLDKWIPGTLTNFKQVSKSIYSYVKFAEIFKLNGSEVLDHSNEILNFPRYYATSRNYRGYVANKSLKSTESSSSFDNKLVKIYYESENKTSKDFVFSYKINSDNQNKSVHLNTEADIKSKMSLPLNGRPDLVILLNPDKNRNVIAEANKLHIPVMALTNTQTQVKGIDYPILCNSSVDFNYYFFKKLIKLCSIYN